MKNISIRNRESNASKLGKQNGVVVIVVTVALIAMVTVTALAIDINHAFANRTKLQNGVDAAALAAAVILDNSTDDQATRESAAKAAAQGTLEKMAASSGNVELDIASADISFTFDQSSNFDVGSCVAGSDCYVRVVVSELELQSYFMRLFSDSKALSASAVAGPSAGGGSCNIVPMAMCATNPEEPTGGYSDTNVYQLKLYSSDSEMGPGNFQLLDLDPEGTQSSDDHLREQMAGSYTGCAYPGDTVFSKPGNTTGPVWQGLNTRVDTSQSNSVKGDFDADTDTTETSSQELIDNMESIKAGTFNADNLMYSHKDYEGNGRRILEVPIIDCSNDNSGKGEFDVVTLGCFFMLRKAPLNSGNNALENAVYSEYLRDCKVQNSRNNGQSNTGGTYRIVLYKDPFNEDS
ncbi:pilus assembly protein TadG-related protein [Acinetobacter venetianus]|uniref:pilus assembly protein TadG-related protein n=1 Tax=Acinetobacter venetianus TaxID=52133 RepID=UPI003A9015DE